MAIVDRDKLKNYAVLSFFSSVIVYCFFISKAITGTPYLWIGFTVLLLSLIIFPLVMVRSLVLGKKLIADGVFTDLAVFVIFGATLNIFSIKYSKVLLEGHGSIDIWGVFYLPALYALFIALIFLLLLLSRRCA